MQEWAVTANDIVEFYVETAHFLVFQFWIFCFPFSKHGIAHNRLPTNNINTFFYKL